MAEVTAEDVPDTPLQDQAIDQLPLTISYLEDRLEEYERLEEARRDACDGIRELIESDIGVLDKTQVDERLDVALELVQRETMEIGQGVRYTKGRLREARNRYERLQEEAQAEVSDGS